MNLRFLNPYFLMAGEITEVGFLSVQFQVLYMIDFVYCF